MQAVGMVNDHTIDCFRYKPLRKNTWKYSNVKPDPKTKWNPIAGNIFRHALTQTTIIYSKKDWKGTH
jgi:hypothetical protein